MRTSNCSLLLIYLPRKDERLSGPGWLTYSERFTHISGYPSAAGERRTAKVHLSETNVGRSTTVPRNQPLYCCSRYVFALSHSLSISSLFLVYVLMPVPCHRFSFAVQESLTDFDEICEITTTNRLHFGRNCDRGKGAGYDRKFELTSTSVAMMSNRCCHLANEFKNFKIDTKADVISDMVSR